MKLEGARIVLTGGSSGLGLTLLRMFVGNGSSVVACARHEADLPNLDRSRFHFYKLDVSEPRQAKKLIDAAVEAFGGIDVLINNASVTQDLRTTEQVSAHDVLFCFRNNVFSVFNTLRYALPIMKSQNKGLAINISSRCGRRAVPRLSAYCATKFAVRGITEAVAKENEGTGVKCISISPAGISTEMRRRLFGEEDARKQQSPERVAEILCKIFRDEIRVPNGADVVIFKDIEPIIKVPES